MVCNDIIVGDNRRIIENIHAMSGADKHNDANIHRLCMK
jgi:hypothetical protein